MSQDMKISEMGVKLIKAFEGYHPVDRELVTGQRVVGYGHRLYSDRAVRLSKSEASELLKDDLAPFEDMLNQNVYAPLSQSQFDALCSLAYNIGPKAFLGSDILRAMNNGRPLDAAGGFDVWRKSTIDGKTYVVDALMRRRAIEKAIFLRGIGGKPVAAPSAALKPVADEALALLSTEDALPVYSQNPRSGLVARAPYLAEDKSVNMGRRLEDQATGYMASSEVNLDEPNATLPADAYLPYDLAAEDIIEDVEPITEQPADLSEVVDAKETPESKETSTLIAKAASQLSDKLDALIDDNSGKTTVDDSNWPETLITPNKDRPEDGISGTEADNVVSLRPSNNIQADSEAKNDKTVDIVIDDLLADDAMREGRNSAAKYIEIYDPDSETRKIGAGYWFTLLLGFTLLGVSVAAALVGDESWLSGWGPLATFVGLIIGGALIVAALYYAIKLSFRS